MPKVAAALVVYASAAALRGTTRSAIHLTLGMICCGEQVWSRPTMDREAFFHRVAGLVRRHGTYSRHQSAWVIAMPYLHMLFEDVLTDRPPEFHSFVFVLEEGALRDFWRTDFDHDHLTEIVVVR